MGWKQCRLELLLQKVLLQFWTSRNEPFKVWQKITPQRFESVSSMAKITPSTVWICFTSPQFRPLNGFDSAEWLFEIQPFWLFFNFLSYFQQRELGFHGQKIQAVFFFFFFCVALNQMASLEIPVHASQTETQRDLVSRLWAKTALAEKKSNVEQVLASSKESNKKF